MKTINPQQLIHHRVPAGAACLSIYARDLPEAEAQLRLARAKARAENRLPELEHLFRPVRRYLSGAGAEGPFPIALFVTRGLSCRIPMPLEVRSLAVLADSFHVKPLLKWMQREHPFMVLLLEDTQATLYQGTLSSFREQEVFPYQELRTLHGVFSALDRAVYRSIQGTRTPLILAGDHDLAEHYANVSEYRAIVDETVPFAGNDTRNLHAAALALLEPYLERREDTLLSQYRAAELNGRAATTLQDVILFALNRKVKHLFVSEGLHLWGRIDPRTGTFTYSREQPGGAEDDVLDDLAELVLRGGGSVTVLPSEKMPHGKVACAILQGVDPASRLERRTPHAESSLAG